MNVEEYLTSIRLLLMQIGLHSIKFDAPDASYQVIRGRRSIVMSEIGRSSESARMLMIQRNSARLVRVVGHGGCCDGCCRRSGSRVALRLAFARLNPVFTHRQRPVDTVQFVIESARVANRLSFRVTAP